MSKNEEKKAELDHIFIWTEREGGLTAKALEATGLVPTYRRKHVGQGTSNICYCFNNAFLELLWIENEDETRSPSIERCRFAERAISGNPFGIAWRGHLPGFASWDFKPPYLPHWVSINVADDSDNLAQPFLFTFAGFKPPTTLSSDRKGNFQQGAGFDTLSIERLYLRDENGPGNTVKSLMTSGIIPEVKITDADKLIIRLKGQERDIRLALPLS